MAQNGNGLVPFFLCYIHGEDLENIDSIWDLTKQSVLDL